METVAIPLSIASGSVLLLVVRELYFALRKRIPKSVQCWFCQHKTKVNYLDSNAWFCPKCEQYNGFTEDGDYNRIIPSQYDEKKNHCVTTVGRKKYNWKKVNSLCDTCNHYQNLKVKQLAAFVPINENRYDEEIEHFSEQLEKCYKLCNDCEILLNNVLRSQQTLSGPRRLIANTINKIQTQGSSILKISLVLSLILTLSATANLHCLQESQTASEFKNWLNGNSVYNEGISLVSPFIPEWLTITLSKVAVTSIVLRIVGALFQTIRCYNHKSLWCFLNWCSWVFLVALAWFPNGYEELITYLQIAIGSVSFVLTALSISKDRYRGVKLKKRRQMEDKNVYASPTFETTQGSPVKNTVLTNESPPLSSCLFNPITKRQNMTDFGLSKLSLGPIRTSPKQSKHQERGPFKIRQDPAMRQRTSPILSPPRFVPSRADKFNSSCEKPLTRSSSYSSGFVSVSDSVDRSRTPSVCDGYDQTFDPAGYITSYNGYSPNSMYSTFAPAPLSPMAYYHFASECQRMYMPPSPSILNSSCHEKCHGNNQVLSVWSIIYLIPILFLVLSNVALLWTVYFKDLLTIRN